MNRNVKELVKQMTLEEKAGMCSGKDFWHLKGVERLGIPEVMVSDGPHGLRKQAAEADHLGLNESIKAVCFPTACATACSFDRELLEKMGETLGDECQAEDVSVILGPAVNIKRSLCVEGTLNIFQKTLTWHPRWRQPILKVYSLRMWELPLNILQLTIRNTAECPVLQKLMNELSGKFILEPLKLLLKKQNQIRLCVPTIKSTENLLLKIIDC